MVISINIDNGFEKGPAKLSLHRVEVLRQGLHEGLTPSRKPAILRQHSAIFTRCLRLILTAVSLVQHLKLPLDLLLDS